MGTMTFIVILSLRGCVVAETMGGGGCAGLPPGIPWPHAYEHGAI